MRRSQYSLPLPLPLRFALSLALLIFVSGIARVESRALPDRPVARPANAQAVSVAQEVQQSEIPNLELVGQIGGPSLALERAGNLLLSGVGPRVYAWDATTEDGPTLLGVSEVLPGIVRDIEVVGDVAYVAAGHLVTMDLTRPESLPLGKQRFAPLNGKKVSAIGYNGDRIYVATLMNESFGGGSFVTLSNTPGAGLQVVRSEYLGGVLRRIEVSGNYAYVVGLEAVGAMDLSDSDAPEEMSSSLHGVNLDAEDDHLVTIERDTVSLWDAANPLASEPIDWKRIPELKGERVDLSGSSVMIAGESGRLVRVPISDDRKLGEPLVIHEGDPETSVYPTGIASIAATTFVSRVDVDPKERWSTESLIMSGARVQAFKDSGSEEPLDIVFGHSLWPSGIAVDGNTLYSAEGGGSLEYLDARLWVHDVADMKVPSSRVFDEDPGGDQPALLVDRDRLVVAGQPGFIELFDVSDPNNPVRSAKLNERWDDHTIALDVEADTLYAAQNLIRRMNIQDITAPTLLEPTHRVGEARDLVVRSNNAYVASRHGFMVVDLSVSPEQGVPNRFLNEVYDAIGVEVVGDLALISTLNERIGLAMVDVSKPDALEIVGQLRGLVGDVALVGDHAIVAGIDKLSVVDISDPRSMSVVREIGIPGFAADGWGFPLGEFPDPDLLAPVGPGDVEIFPRIVVQGDTLYYTFPMAGILEFRIREGVARPTPDPTLGAEIYLPKLMLRHEPKWERSRLVLAPRIISWGPSPDLISWSWKPPGLLFAGYWDDKSGKGAIRALSRAHWVPGGSIEDLSGAPMVMEAESDLLRVGLSRNVRAGEAGELNLYRYEAALERVVGLASLSLDGRPWRLQTKDQISYVAVNRDLPYGPFSTRLSLGFESSKPGSLQIVSVLPDASTTRIGRIDFDEAVADLILMDGRAFTLSPGAGLFEIDIQDPRHPTIMSRLPFKGALTMALNPHRKLLFVIGSETMVAVDVAKSGEMRSAGEVQMPDVIDCPCLRSFNFGGALVVSGQKHLGLFDVRDPQRMAFDSAENFSDRSRRGLEKEPLITDMRYLGPEILVGGTHSALGDIRIVAR